MLFVQLLLIALMLSALSVGGAIGVVPELHRITVEVHGWIAPERFATLFAIAQVAPGPNAQVVALVGWELGGFASGIAMMAMFCAPTSVLAVVIGRHYRSRVSKERQLRIRRALLPISAALIGASAVLIAASLRPGWLSIALVAASGAASSFTRIHPLLIMGAGAAVGFAAGL